MWKSYWRARLWQGIWGVLCGVLLVTACPKVPKEIPCTNDDDCGFPLICFNGFCTDPPSKPPCAVHEDCEADFYCDGLHCRRGPRMMPEKPLEPTEQEEVGPEGGPPETRPERPPVEQDRTPPRVVKQEPAPGATNVSESVLVVAAVFSEPIDETSLFGNFNLYDPQSDSVRVEVRYIEAQQRAELRPLDPLKLSTPYQVELNTKVVDRAGNPLSVPVRWTITTRALAGTVPQVLSTIPADGAASVAPDTEISATFNIELDPASLTSQSMSLRYLGEPIAGTVRYEATTRKARFLPAAPLGASRRYTIFLSTAVRSTKSVPLSQFYQWSFSTR